MGETPAQRCHEMVMRPQAAMAAFFDPSTLPVGGGVATASGLKAPIKNKGRRGRRLRPDVHCMWDRWRSRWRQPTDDHAAGRALANLRRLRHVTGFAEEPWPWSANTHVPIEEVVAAR